MTSAYLWIVAFTIEMILIVTVDSGPFRIVFSLVAGLCLVNALASVQTYIDEKIKEMRK